MQDEELLPLDDTAELSVHSSLQVLHTPGHTPDGLSLYDPLEKRLFSGDALYPARGALQLASAISMHVLHPMQFASCMRRLGHAAR